MSRRAGKKPWAGNSLERYQSVLFILTRRQLTVSENGIVGLHQFVRVCSEVGYPMIVCSCNVLSDLEVWDAAASAPRRSTSHIFGRLGCSAQCGRCVRNIRQIIDEAQVTCSVGCPMHTQYANKVPQT